jgi:hypothetical protein
VDSATTQTHTKTPTTTATPPKTPTPGQGQTSGEAEGSGKIKGLCDGSATFSFDVERSKSGSVKGSFSFSDPKAHVKIDHAKVTSLTIDHKTAVFSGSGFVVTVVDSGDRDTFRLEFGSYVIGPSRLTSGKIKVSTSH